MSSVVRQLAYTMFISNNLTWFDLLWKENLIKHQKSQIIIKMILCKIFLFFYISINSSNCKKQSYLNLLLLSLWKTALKQTWKSFNSKFSAKLLEKQFSSKASSRNFLEPNCSNLKSKLGEMSSSYLNYQKKYIWRVRG